MKLTSFSITLEAWIKLPSGHPSSKLPIICTLQSSLCLSVYGGLLVGQYGAVNVSGSTTIDEDYWTHVALRYEAQSMHFI